jgi:FtsH-binding integral membrane protein
MGSIMKKLRISARYSHLAFGLIQSAITCAVAVASIPFVETGSFAIYWAKTWAISWISMLPVVIFAAPFIRALVDRFVLDSELAPSQPSQKRSVPVRGTYCIENDRRSSPGE